MQQLTYELDLSLLVPPARHSPFLGVLSGVPRKLLGAVRFQRFSTSAAPLSLSPPAAALLPLPPALLSGPPRAGNETSAVTRCEPEERFLLLAAG